MLEAMEFAPDLLAPERFVLHSRRPSWQMRFRATPRGPPTVHRTPHRDRGCAVVLECPCSLEESSDAARVDRSRRPAHACSFHDRFMLVSCSFHDHDVYGARREEWLQDDRRAWCAMKAVPESRESSEPRVIRAESHQSRESSEPRVIRAEVHPQRLLRSKTAERVRRGRKPTTRASSAQGSLENQRFLEKQRSLENERSAEDRAS
jgi:hypothetical protein